MMVRAADVDESGRLRPDSVARLCQEAGERHLDLVGARGDPPAWVLRRMEIVMEAPIVDARSVEVTRKCIGVAERWCSMQVTITIDGQARIDTTGFWVHVSPGAGPAPISVDFRSYLAQTAPPGRLRWRSAIAPTPLPRRDGRTVTLRASDFDQLQHVNNAIYWDFLEHWWADLYSGAAITLEYDRQIPRSETAVSIIEDGTTTWVISPEDGTVYARAVNQ